MRLSSNHLGLIYAKSWHFTWSFFNVEKDASHSRPLNVSPIWRMLWRLFPYVLPIKRFQSRPIRRLPRQHWRRWLHSPLLYVRISVRILETHPPNNRCSTRTRQRLFSWSPRRSPLHDQIPSLLRWRMANTRKRTSPYRAKSLNS